MSPLNRCKLVTAASLLCAAGPLLAEPKIPPKYHATPAEIASLPKYCYNQYVDGSLGGFEYSFPPESCGYEMNHFCPALVSMHQAMQFSLPKNDRIGALHAAMGDIDYTLRGMKPGCFMAQDVRNAKTRAQMLSNIVK